MTVGPWETGESDACDATDGEGDPLLLREQCAEIVGNAFRACVVEATGEPACAPQTRGIGMRENLGGSALLLWRREPEAGLGQLDRLARWIALSREEEDIRGMPCPFEHGSTAFSPEHHAQSVVRHPCGWMPVLPPLEPSPDALATELVHEQVALDLPLRRRVSEKTAVRMQK